LARNWYQLPYTHAYTHIYIISHTGDIGAKLVSAELKDNQDCTSLW
jgi:hypothetical protein